MQVKLKELTYIPAIILFLVIVNVSMSLASVEMPMLSYGMLGSVLAGFAFMFVLYLYEGEMSRYGLVNFAFMAFLLTVTLINGQDFKNCFYTALQLWLILIVMQYYQNNMKLVIIFCAIAFSFCIYCNVVHMLKNPQLWIMSDAKFTVGYLLGNNYNGMGCRMLIGLITNIICLKFSKWWIVNIIALIVCILGPLIAVGSMTALTCIIMFLLFCLIPSKKIKKIGIVSLFTVFVLFQTFVVFSGKGLENNELAVYFIEEVLEKDITFTYRTNMWEAALNVIRQSPLFGYGFVDEKWFLSEMSGQAIGPHNFILSLFIYGGTILFGLYVVICTMAYQSLSQNLDQMGLVLLFGVVTFFFMMLMEMYDYTLVLYIIALAYYYPYLKGTKKEEEVIPQINEPTETFITNGIAKI